MKPPFPLFYMLPSILTYVNSKPLIITGIGSRLIPGIIIIVEMHRSRENYRKRFQGFGCSPTKVVRELGLERRETVWSQSPVGACKLQGLNPSTSGPGKLDPWCSGCSFEGNAK